MTTEEFKKDYPEYKLLEGDALYDAMTTAMFRHQNADQVLNAIKPFWKRYALRYLFYRKPRYNSFNRPEWLNDEVCKNCGRGANTCMMFMRKILCLGCGHELIKVQNSNRKYRIYKFQAPIGDFFWMILQYLHIVKTSQEGRYGGFGDESNYVYYTGNWETGEFKILHKKRKWYEYIITRR